ncbi:unnamed protein product, partial [Sphacelaria rigidula]
MNEQLVQRMAELQATLDPGRLSKRNKSSTHLLDAEKNRNACQAAYMRALKRLKEQLKTWREACGCGFDPSLLSDVAREALLDLQRAGRAGAKIEHILPHLDSSGSNVSSSSNSATAAANAASSGGASGVRSVSPDPPSSKQPRLQDATGISGTAIPSSGGGNNKESGATSGPRGGSAMGSSSPTLLAATPLRSQTQRIGGPMSLSNLGGSGGGGSAGTPPGLSSGSGAGTFGGEFSLGSNTGGGALTSIANPE